MKPDRSFVFLAAVAFAAAAGCHVYVDEPPKSPQTAAAPQHAPTAAPAPAPAPAKPEKVIPLKLHEPGPSGGTTPAPVVACLDTGASTTGDCAALPAPSGCTPGAPTPLLRCNAYRAYFQPKVAAAAVACLTALSGTQICDSTQTSGCAKTALARSCTDPSVAQLCQIAATPCKTTATDCASVISGLNDPGKQMVAQCIAQGCSAGLSGCIDGLPSQTSISLKH
jgi:hypothetical protein